MSDTLKGTAWKMPRQPPEVVLSYQNGSEKDQKSMQNSLDQYSKSWVFKLSLVFFTATVHLQHIGVNLANLLIFACKL